MFDLLREAVTDALDKENFTCRPKWLWPFIALRVALFVGLEVPIALFYLVWPFLLLAALLIYLLYIAIGKLFICQPSKRRRQSARGEGSHRRAFPVCSVFQT